jgi:hypothetical protein
MQLTTTTPALATPAPAPITTPSISSAAMLVELSLSTWTGRKLDKRASAEVTTANNAARGIANVNKKLLGDCAELDAVQKFAANARNAHYAITMPWSDSGLRLLPTTQYFKYTQQISELRAEFDRLVDKFLDAYAWEIGQAQVKLGDLFNPDEYPTSDNLRSKFRFNANFMPVPDIGDWRVDVTSEAQSTLTAHYTTYYTAQLNNAMNSIWHRAYDALSKMSERLDYADSTDKTTRKVFRDSLVENVTEIIDMMKSCNITGDSQMSAMASKLEDALLGVTPDALRADDYLRAETKKRVDDALKALPSLDLI